VNKFSQELGMIIRDMTAVNHEGRKDTAEGEKRVELHMHTNMSVMDATNAPSDLISQAAKWGHKAIAITDHANLQAYPEAHGAGKKNGPEHFRFENDRSENRRTEAVNRKTTGQKIQGQNSRIGKPQSKNLGQKIAAQKLVRQKRTPWKQDDRNLKIF